MRIDRHFWAGRRVLLTGHTGFKGSWLTLWLRDLGAEVTGLSLAPADGDSLHPLLFGPARSADEICDIRDRLAVLARVRKARPEIVLHLAAQPLVRAGYRDPLATFETNAQGTAHVLDALRLAEELRSIVVITTDKVYDNPETARPFVETDPLGGHDPYSASKAAAEIIAASYRRAYFAGRGIGLATARAGNVIGGGDWAEDRLIPDAIRAWTAGTVLSVRRPRAVRPWQHVLEPLAGYLAMAERLWHDPQGLTALNIGPDPDSAATVGEVLTLARQHFGSGSMHLGDGDEGPHEAGYLMLDSRQAGVDLGYRPVWGLEETVARTIDWYRRLSAGERALDLCRADIAAYEARLGLAGEIGARSRSAS